MGLDQGDGPTPQCADAKTLGVPHETDGLTDRCHVHRPQRDTWEDTNSTAARRAAADGLPPPEQVPWVPRPLRTMHQPFLVEWDDRDRIWVLLAKEDKARETVDKAARSNQLRPQQLREFVEASRELGDAVQEALKPEKRRAKRPNQQVNPRYRLRRGDLPAADAPDPPAEP